VLRFGEGTDFFEDDLICEIGKGAGREFCAILLAKIRWKAESTKALQEVPFHGFASLVFFGISLVHGDCAVVSRLFALN